MGFGALPDGCLDLGLSCHGRRSDQINNKNYNNSSSNKSLLSLNYDHSFPSLSLGLIPPQQEDGPYQTRGGDGFVPVESLLQVSSPLSTTAGVSYSCSNVSVKKEREYYNSGGGKGGGGGEHDEAVAEGSGEERLVVLCGSRNSTTTTDEDEEGSLRKKLRLTRDQSARLEESFKDHTTLNPKQKQALADQLNLRPRQVEVWFQNRRARTKLKQTEVDCEMLKKCCETLTEENKRLHKELQELKSMKLVATAAAPPFNMQMPAATLSMCPSCERMTTSADGSTNNNDNNSFRSMNGVISKAYFYNPAAFSHPPPAAC